VFENLAGFKPTHQIIGTDPKIQTTALRKNPLQSLGLYLNLLRGQLLLLIAPIGLIPIAIIYLPPPGCSRQTPIVIS